MKKDNRIAVVCMECGRKFKTASVSPHSMQTMFEGETGLLTSL